MKFRNLNASDIDVRIASIKETGLSLLLYKDARCDMNILDETVGSENWQRKHYECKGNLYCSVGIFTPNNGWVWKDDCGAESYTEKEKGESSDSFKRACFNWGIGRELYTAPYIWISKDNCNITQSNNKFICYDKFNVKSISIVDKKIVDLEIYNEKLKKLVFSTNNRPKSVPDVVCPKCSKPIQATMSKGKKRTPQEILNTLHMCPECYRAGQK